MSTDSFEKALANSWNEFRNKLPGKIGDYLDPAAAFENIIKKNGAAVLQEIKESKDAVLLLWKLAKQGALTEQEEQELKDQLTDLARTIPALGVFALPGGMLLLPILAKALPWRLLPSAFAEELEKKISPKDQNP